MFNITLTKQKALEIQEGQIVWYGQRYPGGVEALRAKIKSMTTADQLQDGVEYSVIEINKHIPRGGAIEHLVGVDFGGD